LKKLRRKTRNQGLVVQSTLLARLSLFGAYGVEVAELDPGIIGREMPDHTACVTVARLVPRRQFGIQGLGVRDAAVQTLGTEHSEFDFSHVEPTAVAGRVVDFQPTCQTPRLLGLEGLVERRAVALSCCRVMCCERHRAVVMSRPLAVTW
jgi:hypothetical protein